MRHKFTPVAPSVEDDFIQEETRGEVETWLSAFDSDDSPRAYTHYRNQLRKLIAWRDEVPELRSQVAKDVVTALPHQDFLADILGGILAERSVN